MTPELQRDENKLGELARLCMMKRSVFSDEVSVIIRKRTQTEGPTELGRPQLRRKAE